VLAISRQLMVSSFEALRTALGKRAGIADFHGRPVATIAAARIADRRWFVVGGRVTALRTTNQDRPEKRRVRHPAQPG